MVGGLSRRMIAGPSRRRDWAHELRTDARAWNPFQGAIMNLAMERGGGRSVIRLAGEVNIGCAAELKALLVEVLSSGEEILIEFERAGAVDVSILQLILAAQREATQTGVRLALSAALAEPVARAVEEAGISPFWIFDRGADALAVEAVFANGAERRP